MRQFISFIKPLNPFRITFSIQTVNQAFAMVRCNTQTQHLSEQFANTLRRTEFSQFAVNPLRTCGGVVYFTAVRCTFFIIQIRIKQAGFIVDIFLEFARIFTEIVHESEQLACLIQIQLGC